MPKQTEILVIGGGIIGSFVAYWMKTISPSFNVTVVEKDSDVTYIIFKMLGLTSSFLSTFKFTMKMRSRLEF